MTLSPTAPQLGLDGHDGHDAARHRDLSRMMLLGIFACGMYGALWLHAFPVARAVTFVFAALWTVLTALFVFRVLALDTLRAVVLALTGVYFVGIVGIAVYVEVIPLWPFDFLMTAPLLYTGVFRQFGRQRGFRYALVFLLACLAMFTPALMGGPSIADPDVLEAVVTRFVLGSVLFFGALSGMERVVEQQTHARTQAEVRSQAALVDALTGLANRRALYEHLRGRRETRARLGLIFIDLDHFKRVNDQFGHQVGDEVLCAVAQRLKSSVRDGDVVYRIAGDEFVVVLDRVTTAGLDRVGERIVRDLRAPLVVSCGELPMTASVGGVVSAEDEADVERLVTCADKAMYQVKHTNRDGWAVLDVAEAATPRSTHDG